ncbi:Anthranilate 1,2-dioxygenase system ferredoxin--NAD(+) reductase component [Ralstonia mannitolilytica]|nr:Anthranilate 1,2-dioxygenase system ferredoxin--NAD(+) reductase component [Ralstonia mannitolilytica]
MNNKSGLTSGSGSAICEGAKGGRIMKRFVIVGAGVAGHRAALELRRLDATAAITLLGDEAGLPYARPPLSKEFLTDAKGQSDILLESASSYSELNIDYMPATVVRSAAPERHSVLTADGKEITYDRLLLATGSRPRKLMDAGGRIHYLRTVEDASRLRAALRPGCRVTIIGGGFIGLEVAAAARAHGCRVTVLEAGPRLLNRGMPELLGNWVRDLHVGNGVEIILDARVKQILSTDWGGLRVYFNNASLEADVVVAGIGVLPNTEVAERAGLHVEDGIVVDMQCRTSVPDVFAAGEVTSYPLGGDGPNGRTESWKVAGDQAIVAAKMMAGFDASFRDQAWLWSDQFDTNIQFIGTHGRAARHVVRGDPASRRWTWIALDEYDRPLHAVAVNNGRDISMLRRAMSMRKALRLPAIPNPSDPFTPIQMAG